MTKIIFTALTFLFLSSINAQVGIAVKGGYNFAGAKAVFADVKQPTSNVSGYGIGVLAKVPFDGVLFFSPSVMINKRGFIVEPLTGETSKEQYGIIYLDLTPSLSVDFTNSNNKNKVVLSLGPNFGLTNFGKTKITDTANVTTANKLKFGYGSIGWFDIGLNAGVGYHTKKILVELNFLQSLTSINNNEELDFRNIRNNMFSLNIGYFIK